MVSSQIVSVLKLSVSVLRTGENPRRTSLNKRPLIINCFPGERRGVMVGSPDVSLLFRYTLESEDLASLDLDTRASVYLDSERPNILHWLGSVFSMAELTRLMVPFCMDVGGFALEIL